HRCGQRACRDLRDQRGPSAPYAPDAASPSTGRAYTSALRYLSPDSTRSVATASPGPRRSAPRNEWLVPIAWTNASTAPPTVVLCVNHHVATPARQAVISATITSGWRGLAFERGAAEGGCGGAGGGAGGAGKSVADTVTTPLCVCATRSMIVGGRVHAVSRLTATRHGFPRHALDEHVRR